MSFDSFFATAEDVIRMSGQKWIVRREFRRHSKMTFAKFWELLTPHPSLSAQSVPHVYKFCVLLDPPAPSLWTSYMDASLSVCLPFVSWRVGERGGEHLFIFIITRARDEDDERRFYRCRRLFCFPLLRLRLSLIQSRRRTQPPQFIPR